MEQAICRGPRPAWARPAGKVPQPQPLPIGICPFPPPSPQRPSWLRLPELSPLASSQASTWQVGEGSVSHSFQENRAPDELPEGEVWVQLASSEGLSRVGCARHVNCHRKRGGDLQAHPGVGPSFQLLSLQLSSVEARTGLRRSIPNLCTLGSQALQKHLSVCRICCP